MRVIPEYLKRLPISKPRFVSRSLKQFLSSLPWKRIPRVHVLTTRNAATGTYIRSSEPLISLIFMLKISVTKENGTYGKASRVVICPSHWAASSGTALALDWPEVGISAALAGLSPELVGW
jgi:hypothetical protein